MIHKIENYSFGSITVDGKSYSHDLIVFKNITDWWRATSHNVSINDIDNLVLQKPKTIIFGTGASGVMRVPQETIDYIEKEGVQVIVLRTAEAAKKYNEMASDDVAAALHLTC